MGPVLQSNISDNSLVNATSALKYMNCQNTTKSVIFKSATFIKENSLSTNKGLISVADEVGELVSFYATHCLCFSALWQMFKQCSALVTDHSSDTQLSIPTHAQIQRHRLKFIKNHLKKTPTCFGLRPSSGSYNVLAKITVITDHRWMFLC